MKTVSWYLHTLNFICDTIIVVTPVEVFVYVSHHGDCLLACGHYHVSTFVCHGNTLTFYTNN